MMKECVKEVGAYVVSEQPFQIRWQNGKKKRRFYNRFFTPNDWVLYEILRDACLFERNCMDYALIQGNFAIFFHGEDTHHQLIDLIEQTDSQCFNRIRLHLVTGSYLIHPLVGYQDTFREQLVEFLDTRQAILRETIENAIEKEIKPLYDQQIIALRAI